jgi:phage-related baseplate assembly protein
MTPIDDLTTPLTVDQVRLSIYSVLGQIGVDTTTWKPGGVVRTMIAGTSIMLSALSRLTSSIAKSGFLETAEGDWLKLLAKNVYNVTPIEATFATGPAVLANSSGGIYVLSDGELQISNTRTGATYVNVGPVTIPAVSSGVAITLTATEAGSGSTALVTDPMAVTSPLPGVTCGLALALIGLDAELDPALRLRCSEKLGALSPNGPPDAYGFVCRSAVRGDGTPIGVTRVRLTKDGFGRIDVYVANAAGGVDALDLPFIDAAVQQQAAPLGVTAFTHSADNITVNIGAHVYCYNNSGFSDAQIQALCTAAVTDFLSTEPIGGDVVDVSGAIYKSAIEAAIGRASPGLKVFRVDLVTPAGDVPLGRSEVGVVGTVGISVHQIPPPGTV